MDISDWIRPYRDRTNRSRERMSKINCCISDSFDSNLSFWIHNLTWKKRNWVTNDMFLIELQNNNLRLMKGCSIRHFSRIFTSTDLKAMLVHTISHILQANVGVPLSTTLNVRSLCNWGVEGCLSKPGMIGKGLIKTITQQLVQFLRCIRKDVAVSATLTAEHIKVLKLPVRYCSSGLPYDMANFHWSLLLDYHFHSTAMKIDQKYLDNLFIQWSPLI